MAGATASGREMPVADDWLERKKMKVVTVGLRNWKISKRLKGDRYGGG